MSVSFDIFTETSQNTEKEKTIYLDDGEHRGEFTLLNINVVFLLVDRYM